MDFMARALELANLALGRTSPNPAVGAVIVKDGLIVGEGFTQPAGFAHAEVMALRAAGKQADGAEIYITLEPCCHIGRTPPCTDAILAAGIRAVHVAVLDPFPAVNGQGVAMLKAAGLEIEVGERAAEATILNQAFFHAVRHGRPFVTAKWAMTLDGKLATSRHDSKWVSGAEARQFVHQERDASDAIIVGLGTVLADDPLLTVRIEANAPRRAYRPVGPLRVVFDSAGHTPPNCQILANVETAPVLIATTQAADSERIRQLQRTGAEVIKFPSLNGYVDARAVLDELKRRGANRVLLEGGSELFGTFFERRLVDRILAFVAPRIAGGREAISPIGGIGVERMADAFRLANVSYRAIGADLLVEGLLEQP